MKLIELILRLLGRKKIDLADYPRPGVDYGTLGGPGVDIPQLSQAEFDAVIAHIGLHFGNGACKNIALKRGNRAAINLEIYRQAVAHKEKLDAQVETALSVLWECSAVDKLKQVANYIAANCKYKTGSNDPLALFGDGGMCGAYSMLFYKMATRLGIPAYICYGYASNGVYTGAHAWNRVDLEDGPRYYDITFYDSGCRSGKWLGSRDGWGREHCLNDKSALQKRG